MDVRSSSRHAYSGAGEARSKVSTICTFGQGLSRTRYCGYPGTKLAGGGWLLSYVREAHLTVLTDGRRGSTTRRTWRAAGGAAHAATADRHRPDLCAARAGVRPHLLALAGEGVLGYRVAPVPRPAARPEAVRFDRLRSVERPQPRGGHQREARLARGRLGADIEGAPRSSHAWTDRAEDPRRAGRPVGCR